MTVAGCFPSKGDKITLEMVRFDRYFKPARAPLTGINEYCQCIKLAENEGWYTKTVFYGTRAVLVIYPRFWDIVKVKLDELILGGKEKRAS